MFYSNQNKIDTQKYKEALRLIGSLSNMFSDSKIPYLYYRIAEKVFCETFNTDDLSRSDVAVDAKYNNLGIGLKTFLKKNDKSLQKIAEFNKEHYNFEGLSNEKLIRRISFLRNQRIEFSKRLYELDDFIYHCVLRSEKEFHIFEEDMSLINIEKIRNIKKNRNSIVFDDELNEYSFSLSKSTLSKRFVTDFIVESFDVNIIENPIEELRKISEINSEKSSKRKINSTVILPLYGKNFTVFERSGLNQWNANGRKRHLDEVYVPIPVEVHKIKPDFFPSRDIPFDLILPNRKIMRSKICQDGSKALMSYSNKELGKWLLRKVLKLDEGELLTYEKLQLIGIDSVRIDKFDDSTYEINFSENGSYEKFIEENT